ncbi:MAG TPA: adenylate/guanylate cyclase domain-containing protein [Solirubrobacterales bacterium]|jgi:class 3 adenylate cyclase|nr:adenylate/guanylate cyclase domain-containing protein [Solirubrobacterales bacterium]
MAPVVFGHPLTWLYGKLGPRYPAVFIALELQSAFVIGIGAVILIGFYYEADQDDVLKVIALTCVLTAIAIAIVLRRIYRRLGPLRRWIAGERGPSETEAAWSTAVTLPLELIRRDAGFPVFGVAIPVSVYTVIEYGLSWLAFIPLFAGSLIALGYSAILHYLALELAMRPILFDINAALHRPVKINRPAIPLRWKLLGSLPLINVITGVTVAALTSDGGGVQALSLNVVIALTVAFLISFELTVLLSRSILRPVEDLEAATERIRQGRFDEHVPVTTADEFGELSSAFNQMVDGLNERERLREAFGTYLDEQVARHIISEDYNPDGHEVEVSLVFCDVQQFTELSAKSSAAEVVQRLNDLFECIVPIIARHRGHVDQFIGDGLLAVWNAPERVDDHADRAVQCAVEIARTVNSRNPGGFEIGIGVNSGPVVAGSIGGAGRLSFSVIGDAVNLCSRVEAKTRDTGDPVLITGATRALLSETMEVEPRGEMAVRGYARPIEIYAPLIPQVVVTGEGGSEIADGIATTAGDGLGRPARAGVGLGKAPASGLGRPGPGRGSGTLPGR